MLYSIQQLDETNSAQAYITYKNMHEIADVVGKNHISQKLEAEGDAEKSFQIERYYSRLYDKIASAILAADSIERRPAESGSYALTPQNKKLIRDELDSMVYTGVVDTVSLPRVCRCAECCKGLDAGQLVYMPDKDVEYVYLCFECCTDKQVVDENSCVAIVR